MKSDFKFTAEENSFIIEAGIKKLRVSYNEFYGPHKNAMKFCKKNGGGNESVENLRFLSRHLLAINKELTKLGKEKIKMDEQYWANENSFGLSPFADTVYTLDSEVWNENGLDDYYARAIASL